MEAQNPSELIYSLQARLLFLKTIVEVTKKICSILDLAELLDTTVNLIRDNLGYYHIHLYLLDDNKVLAVMQAGTGLVGERLLERRFKIEVNDSTLVGWCIQNHQARVIVNGNENTSNFHNPLRPLLSDLCCAGVFPLISRNEVIGVLEIQHVDDFYHGDYDEFLSDFQLIADHTAIAIENARLFGKFQKIVEDKSNQEAV